MPIRKGIEISEADAVEYDKLIEEADYCDRIQYVYKIKLNSFYGAVANRHFKFGDRTLGESTTAGGRCIVTHQHREVNRLLAEEYDEFGEAIIYGDTDSSYFRTYCDNTEDAREVGDAIAEGVNNSFDKFMKKFFLIPESFLGIIRCGREIVADRGIFVAKKKYMLNLTDLDGYSVDKLKVMGLDTKRTTIPKPISIKLESFIARLLKGEKWDDIEQDVVDYKDNLLSSDNILDIGIPSGVNKIEEYTKNFIADPKTFLPGSVAPCVFYNICREENNDLVSPAITSGMKTKKFFLKNKQGRFGTISLPTDMTKYEIPEWFWEFEIDMDTHMDRLVDAPINNVLKAIGEESPTHQSMKYKSLFDF